MPALRLGVSGHVPTPGCGIDRKSGGKTAALQKRADAAGLNSCSSLYFHFEHIAVCRRLTLLLWFSKMWLWRARLKLKT
jgi:hypothetical protein